MTQPVMRRGRRLAALILVCTLLAACGKRAPSDALVMIIESSPANLDPRVGIDAQSERIDELLFDALVHRDQHFALHPWLAESWEIPDPQTYVFHLRRDVRFHDGRPLTARDVKWTFDSIVNGTVRTTKAGTFRYLDHIDAPNDATVLFHLKQPWASLLWNVSNGAIGIVPYGSKGELAQMPVGSGPFRLVRAEQDKDVVIERNDGYWGERPKVRQVEFLVVPDTTTRALELRKGSADVALNSLTADMITTIEKDPRLQVIRGPGTILSYLTVNLRDPILKDVRVRQALAYAIDRRPMIEYLWRNLARPAGSILPPESWAYDSRTAQYPHDPAKARQLLEAAGYPAVNGVRFHLTMKTSTEESTRLLAAVLQQQLRDVGIALDIRSYEFATFFSDVTKGAFQVYSLRWIGGNDDPDIFEYVFDSDHTPPRGANRNYYSNPRVDQLIAQGRGEVDPAKRRLAYSEIQQILAEDLPYINLWYYDNVAVHARRVANVEISPAGNYDFLLRAELRP